MTGAFRWPTSLWRGLDPAWRLALGLLLIQRVVLAIVGVIAAVRLASDTYPSEGWSAPLSRGADPWLLLSTWQRWDAVQYQKIAEVGYQAGDQTTIFYPLYPLLAKLVSTLLGGRTLLAEIIVSSVCFVVALWLLYQITSAEVTRRRRDAEPPVESPPSLHRLGAVATLAMLLVALFPTGFFLLAPFTESLFLALSLATFWFARRQQWWLAGATGFLAALTRANGAALFFPLAFMYLRERGGLSWIRRRGGRPPGFAAFATMLPLAGAAAWSSYLAFIVGEARSNMIGRVFWVLSQRMLGNEPSYTGGPGGLAPTWRTVGPWDALGASISYLAEGLPYLPAQRPGEMPEALYGAEVLNLASLLACCLLAVLVLRWLPLEHSLFLWANLAALLTRHMAFQPLLSTGRYVLILFPCFIVLAMLLARHPRLARSWLIGSAILQIIFFQYFVRWRFVA